MDNYVTNLLERQRLSVSKVKVSVLDRRTEKKAEYTVFCYGDSFNESFAMRDLDKVGYSLMKSEVVDTVYAESPRAAYEALGGEA